MLDRTEEIIGLDVYTPAGILVGKVSDIRFDLKENRADGLIIEDVNPAIAEYNIVINIPFSWISAIGDVVLLKRFPKRTLRDGTLQGL